MLAALVVCVLVALLTLALRYAASRLPGQGDQALAERIAARLPQTQCGQCGFAGCRPYAEAIAQGRADIDQCPPGGSAGIQALADLLGVEPKPLHPRHGPEKPRALAVIDESRCIGCTLCLQACPVDAILGAPKSLHTVIAAECTGCALCVAPCPVDCIRMEPLAPTLAQWHWPLPEGIGP
ncbi:electron transport complex subunit RsxB [Candidatus Methylocalor cossyra]|uniref:SoxR [2Fe-2S] reducing system protein RsxB n=1 Tax=Candidatus Methylocalor cossyra TaxID=3108543 RepID=A0ABP1C5K7_9GAMM